MAYKMTGLTRGLLALVVLGGIASIAWNMGGKEKYQAWKAGRDGGRGVRLVDNTQGADAVIARDPAIRKIEDLAGKQVALLQYTPSHGMLIDAIENSSMTAHAKNSIKTVFIKAEEGTPGVRSAF